MLFVYVVGNFLNTFCYMQNHSVMWRDGFAFGCGDVTLLRLVERCWNTWDGEVGGRLGEQGEYGEEEKVKKKPK